MSTAETKMRDAICALGAKLAARGFCPGTSGNISARVADGWLMTPTNSSLGDLEPGQLSKLDLSGRHVAGDPPTKEALLHRSVYDVRPKDGAIVHLHCTHAVAISCLDPSCHHNAETTLPPITPYFVMRVGKLPLVPYFKPGDPKTTVDSIVSHGDFVMLESHGAGQLQDGREYFNRYAWAVTVKEGLVFSIREYMDSHYVATLFGFK